VKRKELAVPLARKGRERLHRSSWQETSMSKRLWDSCKEKKGRRDNLQSDC
jgi:hypothetical protein